jgi:hypothetical protein
LSIVFYGRIKTVVEIVTWQQQRQVAWRNVPSAGMDVEFNGLPFYVLPVFSGLSKTAFR